MSRSRPTGGCVRGAARYITKCINDLLWHDPLEQDSVQSKPPVLSASAFSVCQDGCPLEPKQ